MTSSYLSLQLDYMLLGLLVYEMATGKRPFGEVYPLSTVVLGLLLGNLELNVEADHFLQKQGQTVREGGREGGREGMEERLYFTVSRMLLRSNVSPQVVSDSASNPASTGVSWRTYPTEK